MNILRNKIIADISAGLNEIPVDKILEHVPATLRIFVRKDTIDLAIAAAQDAVRSDAFAQKVDGYIDAVKKEFKSMLSDERRDETLNTNFGVGNGGFIDVD